MDTEKLIEKSKEILRLCVNGHDANNPFCGYRHHLPLKSKDEYWLDPNNWDLPTETMEMVVNNLKDLGRYADEICEKYYPHTEGKRPIIYKDEILPKWIVFPHYSAETIGWRMGIGEAYALIAHCYYDSLSEEEKKQYRERYPIPPYMQPPYCVGIGLSRKEREEMIECMY